MDIQEREIDIECALISKSRNEESKNKRKCDEFFEEVKKLLGLAGPLMSVNLLLYCLQVISVMFIGHLGELALSGASMATSFATVTGFSLLVSLFLVIYFTSFYIHGFWLILLWCLLYAQISTGGTISTEGFKEKS